MSLCSSLKRYHDYSQLQLHISARIKWSSCVEQLTRKQFQQWADCQKSYEKTFISWSKFQSSYINQGVYGKVFKMRIKDKKAPPFPIAIKRSFGQEIDEARYMVRVTALVEAGVNPHFTMLYSHFHCEEGAYQPKTQDISYLDALKQIEELEERRKQLRLRRFLSYPDRIEYQSTIPKKIKSLIQQRVPRIEEIQWVAQMKSSALREYKQNEKQLSIDTDTDTEKSKELQARQNYLLDVLKKSTLLLRDMLEKRKESAGTKPYEIFVMEYNDGHLWDWIQKRRSTAQLFSMAFQVCMALVSLVSYWDMVQNDLNLKNIMYVRITHKPLHRKWYAYKIGRDHIFQAKYHGYLFKVIDFGLATSINQEKDVYCVGGKKRKECTVYNRDLVEFFYHLKHLNNLPKKFKKWVHQTYNILIRNPVFTMNQLTHQMVQIVQTIPSDIVRSVRPDRFSNSNTTTTTTTKNNRAWFQITATPSTKSQVHQKAALKKWFENVTI